MTDKDEVKKLRYKLNPALTKLENVATAMNQSGNRQAMTILDAISNIECVLDEAERLAKKT